MSRDAYLVCWFSLSTGVPVFVDARIYSESARSLTIDGGVDGIGLDMLHCTGSDYEDAIRNVFEGCRGYEQFRWVLPYLEYLGDTGRGR